MRYLIAVLLAASGLLALSACGSPGAAPLAAKATATVTVTTGAATPSITSGTAPAVERRTITRTRAIRFATRRVNDPSLAKGTAKLRRHGVAGVMTLTYRVTITNGVRTGKKLVRKVVTTAPVTRVIAAGTRQAPQCDPNYSGACVPIASDVDCAGGSGNGPAYVQGPVRVVGTDIYGLDANGDGIGCES
jgi:resuscitation-promoting factor RpfB